MSKKTKVAVVDDHKLFRSGMIKLIQNLNENFEITIEASNGKDFLDKLKNSNTPDLALIDISMPIMDGFKTVEALNKEYPDVKILIITMNDDENSLIKMLQLGVKGYINKDIEPHELNNALNEMVSKGYYYTEKMTSHLIKSVQFPNKGLNKKDELNERELTFIQLACSENTYEKIADTMRLSIKTIDGYRSSVFEKLNVKSRVGLVMYAIKVGLVDIKKD